MSYKVMQIETSNVCSLSCAYCPHPSQIRPKGNMSMATFEKCIELVKRSDNPVSRGRQFVWLNHFGEPLLNPLLPDFVAYALSQGVEVSFASNGVDHSKKMFSRELWQRLADAGLKGVVLSAHIKSEGALREQVDGIVDVIGLFQPKPQNLHDWAGQVDVERYRAPKRSGVPETPCDYQTHNMFAVTWDGMLAACCYDIEGNRALSVDDVLENGFEFRPISLCSGCALGRGDAGWLADPLAQVA
jgi:Radical SAM superfamily